MLTAAVTTALVGAAAALLLLVLRARRGIPFPDAFETERARARHAPHDEVTATHEAGHVVLAWASPFVSEVTGVALSDGGESGVTRMTRGPIDGRARRWDAITISLAGIAAEAYAFGRFSTRGSGADLCKAREWAEDIVQTCGVSADATAAPWQRPVSRSNVDVGAMFGERPSEDVCLILNVAYRHAKSVIAMRPADFQALVQAIRARGRLSEDDLKAILGPRPWAIFAPRR